MNSVERLRLGDPEFFAGDFHPTFAELRRSAPVAYDERLGVWVVSRHTDVARALRSPQLLSSRFGVMPDEQDRPDVRAGRVLAGGELMLASDPPRHTALRCIVQPGFAVNAFTRWEPGMRALVQATLDALPRDEPLDARERVAKPLAIGSICAFIGIPERDTDWVGAASGSWVPTVLTDGGPTGPVAKAGTLEAYFVELLEKRRRHPADDVLTAIATAGEDEAGLASKLMLCIDMVIAGDEPTAQAISGAFEAFVEHPEQLEALVADPSLVPLAADEILRWVSPVPLMCRTALEDVAIGEAVIPAGAYVYLVLASANRDEAVWENADQFDVSRVDAAKHVVFGKGIHACIGAGVVRRLLRILLDELVARSVRLCAAGEVLRNPSTHTPTITRLPVRLERR